jgi:hypothetical protein
MKDDAIATDVSTDDQKEEFVQNFFADRNSMVDSIIQQNDEERIREEKEAGIVHDEDVDDQDEGQKDSDDSPGDDDPGGKKDGDQDQKKEEMVTVIVDGEEREVPLSKILDAGKRTLQKESAADKRLEEATNLLKEAKAQKPPEKDTDTGEESKKMTPKEIAHAIQYGTEDEAAAAIEQLNTMGRGETVTPEKIAEIAKKTVQETNNAEKIFTKFNAPEDKGGFKDLADDPYLRNLAIEKVNERLGKGEPNSWETYEAAGKDVRSWMAKFKGEKDPFSDKKDKKKTIDNVKAANAVVNQKPIEKSQSASDVIEEMAASRPGR